MGIFQQFPYSNFHEFNLDQIIKIMREMQDEWAATKTEWASYKDFIDNYFATLDVSDEVLKALRIFAADGTLNQIMDPVIVNETAAWLAEHITPTTPAIDDTLSIQGAAADAKATGDSINKIEEALEGDVIAVPVDYELSNGYISASNGQYVDNSGYRVTDFIPVDPGDVYQITATGSLSVFLLALYEDTVSDALLNDSIKGNSDSTVATTHIVEIPEQISVRHEAHSLDIVVSRKCRIHLFEISWNSARHRQHVKDFTWGDALSGPPPELCACARRQFVDYQVERNASDKPRV